jgi:hypothetical protein
MKKAFLIILLAMSGAFSMVSCTEEVVVPQETEPGPPNNGGGDQGGKL